MSRQIHLVLGNGQLRTYELYTDEHVFTLRRLVAEDHHKMEARVCLVRGPFILSDDDRLEDQDMVSAFVVSSPKKMEIL